MSLLSRIGWLERKLGTDKSPRRIQIWFGPHYWENWTEWRGDDVGLYVRTPERTPDLEVDPMDYLTPEQRCMIRPGDSVVAIQSVHNGRDSHLQRDRPPWKRSNADLDWWAQQRVNAMASRRERGLESDTGPADAWAEQRVKEMADERERENGTVIKLPFKDGEGVQ